MILGKLASVARLFAQFYAGIKKSLSNFFLLLLQQLIKFVLSSLVKKGEIKYGN